MADAEWYYMDGNKRETGPISEGHLRELAMRKVITDGSLVWREGMTEWDTWSNVAQATGAVAPTNVLTQMMASNKRRLAESHTRVSDSKKRSGLISMILIVAAIVAFVICGVMLLMKSKPAAGKPAADKTVTTAPQGNQVQKPAAAPK